MTLWQWMWRHIPLYRRDVKSHPTLKEWKWPDKALWEWKWCHIPLWANGCDLTKQALRMDMTSHPSAGMDVTSWKPEFRQLPENVTSLTLRMDPDVTSHLKNTHVTSHPTSQNGYKVTSHFKNVFHCQDIPLPAWMWGSHPTLSLEMTSHPTLRMDVTSHPTW